MSPAYSIVTKTHNYKRIIIIVIAILAGLPLLFFGILAVQGLLANAADGMPHDVVVSDISKSTATITWVTDNNVQAVVEYGVSPTSLTFYAPEQSARNEHSTELTLLTSSTTYYFQIRVGDTVYDNGGMPWTFTTKSANGEDVKEEVRGISTRISKVTKKTPTPEVLKCEETECPAIQKKLGKGCTVSDYVKCLATAPKQSIGTSVTPTSPVSPQAISITPQPTTILIKSEMCRFGYLQAGSTCSKWTWGESLDVQEPICKKAFYRYVLECKRNDFNTSGGEIGKWSIYEIGNPTYNIDDDLYDLISGDTVYCRVRAEDKDGNATEWQNNNQSKKCE